MSVHSQPCESRALLQVPGVSPVHPQPAAPFNLPRITLPMPSPSPRALRRQVRAVHACKHDISSFRLNQIMREMMCVCVLDVTGGGQSGFHGVPGL